MDSGWVDWKMGGKKKGRRKKGREGGRKKERREGRAWMGGEVGRWMTRWAV